MKYWDNFLSGRKKVHLVPCFGASCKPFNLLACHDIHPCHCRRPEGCPECSFTGGGPIRKGSSLVCMVCHKSGKDHYKSLKPPAPTGGLEKKQEKKVECKPPMPETRKEKRKKRFGPSGNCNWQNGETTNSDSTDN